MNNGKRACAQAANLLSGVLRTSSRQTGTKSQRAVAQCIEVVYLVHLKIHMKNSRSTPLLCSPNSVSLQDCHTAHTGAPLQCYQSSPPHPQPPRCSDWPAPRSRLAADARRTQEVSKSRNCCGAAAASATGGTEQHPAAHEAEVRRCNGGTSVVTYAEAKNRRQSKH